MEVDDIEQHMSFICLRIRFPTSTPLEPGFYFTREDGAAIWVGFKYERLSSFFVHCGLLDHTIGTYYQNLAHPQSYALMDKMRGFPPILKTKKQMPMGLGEVLQEGQWRHSSALRSAISVAAMHRPEVATVVSRLAPRFALEGVLGGHGTDKETLVLLVAKLGFGVYEGRKWELLRGGSYERTTIVADLEISINPLDSRNQKRCLLSIMKGVRNPLEVT